MSITRRQFAKSISLIMASSLFTGPFPSQAAISRGKEPIVETQYGKVRGIRQENGVYSFRGIPYAASNAIPGPVYGIACTGVQQHHRAPRGPIQPEAWGVTLPAFSAPVPRAPRYKVKTAWC